MNDPPAAQSRAPDPEVCARRRVWLASLVLVVPLGYGLPYLLGRALGDVVGLGALLLLSGPSAVVAGLLRRWLAPEVDQEPRLPAGCCLASGLSYLLVILLTAVPLFGCEMGSCTRQGWLWLALGSCWPVLIVFDMALVDLAF